MELRDGGEFIESADVNWRWGDDDGSELNCGLGSVGTLFVEYVVCMS